MTEFRFQHPVDHVPAGRVAFHVVNRGKVAHQLVLILIPADLPHSLDTQLKSKSQVAAVTMAILPTRNPGGYGTFARDMEPGRYGMICFLEDGDGVQHALKGMSSEFVVRPR